MAIRCVFFLFGVKRCFKASISGFHKESFSHFFVSFTGRGNTNSHTTGTKLTPATAFLAAVGHILHTGARTLGEAVPILARLPEPWGTPKAGRGA